MCGSVHRQQLFKQYLLLRRMLSSSSSSNSRASMVSGSSSSSNSPNLNRAAPQAAHAGLRFAQPRGAQQALNSSSRSSSYVRVYSPPCSSSRPCRMDGVRGPQTGPGSSNLSSRSHSLSLSSLCTSSRR